MTNVFKMSRSVQSIVHRSVNFGALTYTVNLLIESRKHHRRLFNDVGCCVLSAL